MSIRSKLPEVGTTIFTTMSALAAQHGAINLSQGFPDYPCAPGLLDALSAATQAGHNQYAPMAGLPALRQAITDKLKIQHAIEINPETEITITAGATQALFTAIAAVLHAGDEAILLDPSYDSYAPSILAQGAKPVHIALSAPDFSVDWQRVESTITPRTRLILINNPNNPATSTLSSEDLDILASIAEKHDLIILADEVYEHLIYDGATHHSVLAHPALRERSFAVYSFGKTFHATGWKVGYCVAPPALTSEFRKIHQFLVFAVNTPAQHALAAHLSQASSWQGLPAFFETKRALLTPGLVTAGFKLLRCRGTYFQLADYSDIRPDLNDIDFARWLTIEHGVASIPISAFYKSAPDQQIVRFCFAKQEQTLLNAIDRLKRIRN
ncbi:methionine aminotransferase [Uliginosibacterium gangwonense]|uniref:methionine aminotransferase n=1 Tax=Uliginosibacterium gangwonense TaxID=392736 RepID=UPI0003641DFF|nr:methionine aminotransferase [Uliginosibacterium gangwonense]